MNGKELIKAAMSLQQPERTPWVPFVGCHGGSLIGVDAGEYLKSEDNIVRGASEAVRRYKPDGLPVVFDLQIEAEILGCELMWAAENPSAVCSHPLMKGMTLQDLHIPEKEQGRLPIVLKAAGRIRDNHPDIALYGLITGPFTLAMHLCGYDLFMKMHREKQYIIELLDFCKKVCFAMSNYYIEIGCDVIALVDPMTSQIGPKHFRQFVTSPATEIFGHIRQKNTLSSFFVCGQAQQNIEAMCECRPDNVSVDENIPLDYVRDICLEHNISFGGNLRLTVALLLGKEEDALQNTRECIEIGGKKGFILAPGCDLPYSTPPANLEAIARFIHDPYQQEVIRTLQTHEKSEHIEDIIDISDYSKRDKVIVDIITLDSAACAPCQYMVESVKEVVPEFGDIVEWREHKIKDRKSLALMSSLMVKNIPTICIDGKISFESGIPPREELITAIQQSILEKSGH
jgi:MtaA/CmuA family methyltransferase